MKSLKKITCLLILLGFSPTVSHAQYWTIKDIANRVWYLAKYHSFQAGEQKSTIHFADNVYLTDVDRFEVTAAGSVKSFPKATTLHDIISVDVDTRTLKMYYTDTAFLSFEIVALTKDYLEIVDKSNSTQYLFISDFKYNP